MNDFHDYYCSLCLDPGCYWLDGRMYCDPCWTEAWLERKEKDDGSER